MAQMKHIFFANLVENSANKIANEEFADTNKSSPQSIQFPHQRKIKATAAKMHTAQESLDD